MESDGICDFETPDLEHPRLSGSPFNLAGYSIGDRYFREVFDRYKALHIAEAQRIAKLAADRDLLRTVFPTIRTFCLSLPEAKEVETEFGWTFSAGHKVFVREIYEETVGIGFRATDENAKLFLAEDHFSTCRIPGSKQWICRHIRPIPDRQELECLIIESYRLIALKRSLKALESILRPGELFGDVSKCSET